MFVYKGCGIYVNIYVVYVCLCVGITSYVCSDTFIYVYRSNANAMIFLLLAEGYIFEIPLQRIF